MTKINKIILDRFGEKWNYSCYAVVVRDILSSREILKVIAIAKALKNVLLLWSGRNNELKVHSNNRIFWNKFSKFCFLRMWLHLPDFRPVKLWLRKKITRFYLFSQMNFPLASFHIVFFLFHCCAFGSPFYIYAIKVN